MQRFPLHKSTRTQVANLAQEFLAAFYRTEITRKPDNFEALAELGHVLTGMGRFEEGLAVDRQLVRLAPDNAIVFYNLACSLALTERIDEALDALEEAVRRGYDDVEHLVRDEDLSAVRHEARFEALLRRLGEAHESSL